MKNTSDISDLIGKLQQCNLSQTDKKRLITIIINSNGNRQQLIIEFLKIVGLGKEIFKIFGIDPSHFLDKFK